MSDPYHPTWPTLDAFYDEDERRRFSPEEDFGSNWCMEDRNTRSRLSWLRATGEVILVNVDSTHVELIGWTPNLKTLQRVLKGWEHQHGAKSYYWARQRLVVGSGHRGAQERVGNTHAGNEDLSSVREEMPGTQSLF
jgi:hypothetical protein